MQNRITGTFLVVDDDEGMRGLLEALLENAGIPTVVASDGPTAKRLLQAHKDEIQGCLLDLNLEDCQGEHLYDDLRAISPDLAVFPMSGCFSEEIHERLGDRPVAGVISKPFPTGQLIDLLAEGLAAREKR